MIMAMMNTTMTITMDTRTVTIVDTIMGTRTHMTVVMITGINMCTRMTAGTITRMTMGTCIPTIAGMTMDTTTHTGMHTRTHMSTSMKRGTNAAGMIMDMSTRMLMRTPTIAATTMDTGIMTIHTSSAILVLLIPLALAAVYTPDAFSAKA
eukprot:gene3846-4799_t